MQKLLLFAAFIWISNCGKDSKNEFDLVSQSFDRTQTPKYSKYISGEDETEKDSPKKNPTQELSKQEPVPSFQPQKMTDQVEPPISEKADVDNKSESKEESKGFFGFISDWFGEDIVIEKDQTVCKELLDINKIVVAEQNSKL